MMKEAASTRERDPEKWLSMFFGSRSRARIVLLFYADPAREFYQPEVMYETGLSLQPVQRELANLTRLGILSKRKTRTRVYYRLAPSSPISQSFKQLVELAGRF